MQNTNTQNLYRKTFSESKEVADFDQKKLYFKYWSHILKVFNRPPDEAGIHIEESELHKFLLHEITNTIHTDGIIHDTTIFFTLSIGFMKLPQVLFTMLNTPFGKGIFDEAELHIKPCEIQKTLNKEKKFTLMFSNKEEVEMLLWFDTKSRKIYTKISYYNLKKLLPRSETSFPLLLSMMTLKDINTNSAL
jgi:hypothetical protein